MYLVRKGNSGNHLTHSMTIAASPMVDQWEIPVNKVIIETKFGEGCFGEVHKGFVRGPIHNSPTMKGSICIAVAIKTLKCKAIMNVFVARWLLMELADCKFDCAWRQCRVAAWWQSRLQFGGAMKLILVT